MLSAPDLSRFSLQAQAMKMKQATLLLTPLADHAIKELGKGVSIIASEIGKKFGDLQNRL